MEEYFGLVELLVVVMFAMAWGVLEWQGRRLDRKRDAERVKAKAEVQADEEPRS